MLGDERPQLRVSLRMPLGFLLSFFLWEIPLGSFSVVIGVTDFTSDASPNVDGMFVNKLPR